MRLCHYESMQVCKYKVMYVQLFSSINVRIYTRVQVCRFTYMKVSAIHVKIFLGAKAHLRSRKSQSVNNKKFERTCIRFC